MSLEDEITKAIAAHGLWKAYLLTAIRTDRIDAEMTDAGKDDVCSFGQWLYGHSIGPVERASPDYAYVRIVHARFHTVAATVLQLAAAGRKAEADEMMKGEYTRISADLNSAMTAWKFRMML
jgi:hypothetical protein